MDKDLIRLVIEGGGGVLALYLLAGVKHELGRLCGMLSASLNNGGHHERD